MRVTVYSGMCFDSTIGNFGKYKIIFQKKIGIGFLPNVGDNIVDKDGDLWKVKSRDFDLLEDEVDIYTDRPYNYDEQ